MEGPGPTHGSGLAGPARGPVKGLGASVGGQAFSKRSGHAAGRHRVAGIEGAVDADGT